MAMSRSRGETSLITRSPIVIVPDVIFSRPATMRSAVVFPHPEGPTKIMNSPSSIASERSRTATVPPGNSFVTWSNVSPGMSAFQSRRRDAADEEPLRDEEQEQDGDARS